MVLMDDMKEMEVIAETPDTPAKNKRADKVAQAVEAEVVERRIAKSRFKSAGKEARYADMDREASIVYAKKYLEDLLSFFGLNTEVYATADEDD